MTGIDQDEFDEIFLDWYGPVRNYIYYKTGDIQDAEDIVQETFLKVWEKRETVNIHTIGPFLYRISGNIFLNSVGRRKVSLKFISDYDPDQFSESPEFLLEMKDFDLRLQESISQLDEKSRTVFLMNRIDDMTYSQIAENLGLTVKAIEKRMTKALTFLKNSLNVKL